MKKTSFQTECKEVRTGFTGSEERADTESDALIADIVSDSVAVGDDRTVADENALLCGQLTRRQPEVQEFFVRLLFEERRRLLEFHFRYFFEAKQMIVDSMARDGLRC